MQEQKALVGVIDEPQRYLAAGLLFSPDTIARIQDGGIDFVFRSYDRERFEALKADGPFSVVFHHSGKYPEGLAVADSVRWIDMDEHGFYAPGFGSNLAPNWYAFYRDRFGYGGILASGQAYLGRTPAKSVVPEGLRPACEFAWRYPELRVEMTKWKGPRCTTHICRYSLKSVPVSQ